MSHNHSHAPTNYGRAFGIGIALNLIYVAVEAGFGLWDNSLALLSDAGHNFSDVIGLLLAWGGFALARIPPSPGRTYGWRGSTILAALFNALLLLAAIGAIVWEALRRLYTPSELPGTSMIAVAAIGIVVNTATALLFMRGRHHDINIRGAFLHMAADAGVSLGVVLAGIVIRLTGWHWVDPVTSLAIAAVIFLGTWGLLKESLNLAMHAVPPGIDPQEVQDYLATVPGITEVHDLHIWAMSTTETALTVHLVKPAVSNDDELLCNLQTELHDRFGIEHTTIQIMRAPATVACTLAGGHKH
ncbi:MAG: cation diffusion facilitator family transporter [Bythopirellula sp.]|nr:cation diffusion facilitator family transporter [Bythopirellula sp.]